MNLKCCSMANNLSSCSIIDLFGFEKLENNHPIPSGNYEFESITKEYHFPWEIKVEPYINNSDIINSPIHIITQFASHILENSQELEPEIVEFINECFWDLTC